MSTRWALIVLLAFASLLNIYAFITCALADAMGYAAIAATTAGLCSSKLYHLILDV